MSPESSLSFRSNPTSSIETRIRHRFLRCLMRIKSGKAVPTIDGDVSQRSKRIKMAALSSMALAAGPKRAWSRALIFKIRNRVRWYSKKRYVQRRSRSKKCIKNRKPSSSTAAEISRVDKLRKLVPGGDAMDLCKLLEETAVYVKYLSAQVNVMQKVADDLSARGEKTSLPSRKV